MKSFRAITHGARHTKRKAFIGYTGEEIGDLMRKAIMFLGIILMLFPSITGESLLFSETIEFKSVDDQYNQILTYPVWVKKGSTYESEDRSIHIIIGPRHFVACYGEDGSYGEEKDYFFEVLVSVMLNAQESFKDFESYLNHTLKDCDNYAWKGHLFWDHAGETRADKAGTPFMPGTPLVVTDEYFEVTLRVLDVRTSNYYCTNNDQNCLDCRSDAECFIFLDSLTLSLSIQYSSDQLNVVSSFDTASQHIESGRQFAETGEFEKAKAEYEKAKAIYDDIGDELKSQSVQAHIDDCDSYITGQKDFTDGMQLFQEAGDEDDYDKAIEKYEEARSHFEEAQSTFEAVDSPQADECGTWIDRCDDEISNLEEVGTLRTRLVYIIVAIAGAAGAGLLIKQVGRGKGKKEKGKPPTEKVTLTVQCAETGKTATITVGKSDRIGKVRQLAGTRLGIVPLALLYKGKACPPDKTVEECGLKNKSSVTITVKGVSQKEKDKKKEKRIVYCPQCGTENPADSAFCGKCGTKL